MAAVTGHDDAVECHHAKQQKPCRGTIFVLELCIFSTLSFCVPPPFPRFLPLLLPGSPPLCALFLEKQAKMQNNHDSRQYCFIYQSCTYVNV